MTEETHQYRSALIVGATILIFVGVVILVSSGPASLASLSAFVGAVGILVARFAKVWFG